MNTIIAILRAAHCKSTHHYFAIDALDEVASPRGKALCNLLLANYNHYLKGAKAPDTVFKDFENHVLHVRDDYWGGAAKTAEKWLDRSLRLLSANEWKEAAYAIGVLSHYFSDPFMPLHTAQSPRETIVHRPLEWSVCCSYRTIFKMACNDSTLESFELASGSQWITDSVLRGATMSNRFYESLMDDYDMKESSKHPELALGSEALQTLARIFTWVLTGWGNAIDRIANESTAAIPNVSLVVPTLLAGVQVPVKKIVAAIESAEQRKEVEMILDEFQRTGNVVRNVAPEQRIVQKARLERPELRPSPLQVQLAVTSDRLLEPRIDRSKLAPRQDVAEAVKAFVTPIETHDEFRSARIAQFDAPTTPPMDAKPSKRSPLSMNSPVVDAPAIGPKTAARFHDIGMATIRDLLSRDPKSIAAELNTKWISEKTVSQWQVQARLACQIERISAAGSGLLVMAGIRTAQDLAKCETADAFALIQSVAQTTEGRRLLRDHEPPPMKTVQRWIDAAKSAGPNYEPDRGE